MPVAKYSKMMRLKLFLWLVVYAFLIYAIIVDGPSTGILVLSAAAVIVCAMQIWMRSERRARWMKDKVDKK